MGKMMMMFCVAASVLLAVLPNLLWFLSWIVAKIFRSGVPYAPFGWTALVLNAPIIGWTMIPAKGGRIQK